MNGPLRVLEKREIIMLQGIIQSLIIGSQKETLYGDRLYYFLLKSLGLSSGVVDADQYQKQKSELWTNGLVQYINSYTPKL